MHNKICKNIKYILSYYPYFKFFKRLLLYFIDGLSRRQNFTVLARQRKKVELHCRTILIKYYFNILSECYSLTTMFTYIYRSLNLF